MYILLFLQNPMVSLYIEKAKDRYIARELALLRASKPVPPMVSHLDEVDASAIEEGVRRVIEARSQAAASATVPPLSGPLRSSPPASQASCDPDRQAPSTSQVCDPETVPAVQDPCQQAKRGRRHSVVSTPDPGCRNCQLLSAELKVVKDLLEIEIERNDELKQLHCSTMRATVSVELFLWCIKSDNFFQLLLIKKICFMCFFSGSKTSQTCTI